MRPRSVLHRLVATIVALACAVPLSAVCGPAAAGDDAMAGMACCRKLAPASSGTVEKDCCRMEEQAPESMPAAPLPPRASVTADSAPALIAGPALHQADNTRAHYDLQSARGRPNSPAFLRTSVLLI
jgi:hypothetical protein